MSFDSNSTSSSPIPTTFTPLYQHDEYLQFPSLEEFSTIVNDYLQNLSSKKRDKALVDSHRYSLILQVLKDPRNTAISTAQFRFWVKKMFRLDMGDYIVCHDNKPVATREDIYQILIMAHKEAHHGGRDKTSALVRKRYSWIPKELIARFVRHCPFCISRRNGCIKKSPTLSSTELLNYLTSPSEEPLPKNRKVIPDPHVFSSIANVATFAAAAAVASNAPLKGFFYHEEPYSNYLNQTSNAAAVVAAAAAMALTQQEEKEEPFHHALNNPLYHQQNESVVI